MIPWSIIRIRQFAGHIADHPGSLGNHPESLEFGGSGGVGAGRAVPPRITYVGSPSGRPGLLAGPGGCRSCTRYRGDPGESSVRSTYGLFAASCTGSVRTFAGGSWVCRALRTRFLGLQSAQSAEPASGPGVGFAERSMLAVRLEISGGLGLLPFTLGRGISSWNSPFGSDDSLVSLVRCAVSPTASGARHPLSIGLLMGPEYLGYRGVEEHRGVLLEVFSARST